MGELWKFLSLHTPQYRAHHRDIIFPIGIFQKNSISSSTGVFEKSPVQGFFVKKQSLQYRGTKERTKKTLFCVHTWELIAIRTYCWVSNVGMIQCVANKEPDVDSIHRLTSHHLYPFYFLKKPYSITVPLNMVVPTNAQATIFFKRTFWALFLPSTVHGRVTDIWRAYITQSLYHRTKLNKCTLL